MKKLSFARQRSTPTVVCCDDLLRDVLSLRRPQTVKTRIEIDISALTPTPILCYDGEVRQIQNNLIANAIEAAPEGGCRIILRTRLFTRRSRPGALVTIADTEVGMYKQTLAKIFTPFCSTKGESGNGLGLWISREFAHRHGGTLRVKSSQQPGQIG